MGSPALTWHMGGSPANLQLIASGKNSFIRGRAHHKAKQRGGKARGQERWGSRTTCRVPAADPLQPSAKEGTRWDRPCTQLGPGHHGGGTRREAAALAGTFLLSSSRGWKIYKACSENIYTAAIFGGIWDVNLKNLWGENHNGLFERASVAIAPTRPRRRGAPPAAAPALMGASPAGSPPGSRGGRARHPPPPPRTPNCIQSRSLPPSAPGEQDRGAGGVRAES